MLGIVGLDDHFAGFVRAAGASRHLGAELESTFRGTKIRDVEADIGVDDAHQRHIGKIKAFGDHLRAEQDIHVAVFHTPVHRFVSILAAGGIRIQAQNAGQRKTDLEQLLDLLRARSAVGKGKTAAVGALARTGQRVAAIVAVHFLAVAMVIHADLAIGALDQFAAFQALHERGKSAPVLEEDDLLLTLQTGVDSGDEFV